MVGTPTEDPRFFARSGLHHLAAVAKAASGIAPELDLPSRGVAPLQTAGSNEVSFLDNSRSASILEQALAGAVIVHPDMQARVPAAVSPAGGTDEDGGIDPGALSWSPRNVRFVTRAGERTE